ncbi:polymorphic toxin-type HINT domain-containing protein [Streptomyces melanogenes]|uniref:polymorphic toxin-type HINT domain-containing protein n=1 Tax=Streptomyces melanogenes TaxID=67326 RepID=UPI00167CA9D0|nr:polymorphic toxin-type HINT domain-containing protein [Streptomyces melanogenes]
MSATLVLAILGGSTAEATAATTARAEQASYTNALATLDRAAAALPKAGTTPPPAPRSELDRLSAERDRQLVEDYAEFDEEDEVREAAKKALESSDANAIKEFLEHGEAEARQRAKDKRDGTDVKNRKAIEAMRGTGGPVFNAEVERALKSDAKARADFLAFGADIARAQDKKNDQSAKERAAELRKRVEMLVASGGPEVKKAAAAALATGDDKVIAEFLEKGYQIAAQKDADDRAAHEKALKEAQEAADKLRDLAEKAARAAEARTKLITAHGNAVKALKEASNAMTSAAGQARQADRMLSADRAGKTLSSYDSVKAEAARQVTIASGAAKAAQVAAGQAKVQAGVLVETGLTYGTQWSEVASGIAAAADAAVKASQTAQHAIEATEADAKGLNAKNQAELHEQQAKQWRANAEQHAKAAATLAEAAEKQAKIAADAAAHAKTARIAAEKAEKEAWEHAKKTREARVEAQRQAKIAAEQRAIAERERDLAAQARARAEKERDLAAAARARAEAEARTASAARADAQAAAATAASARADAEKQEGIAAKADENARGMETASREAWRKSREARMDADAKASRAQATASMAAAAKGTAYSVEAQTAATAARADADTANTAAGQAQNAADTASGAAVRARTAATQAAGAAARARAAAAEATAHAARANAAANKAEAAAAAANAAANRAEAEAAATHAAALRANTQAAEATAQEARAGVAAHEAARLAGLAAVEANNALQAANRTKAEAEGAVREAAMARLQAGIAVQASNAARTTAAGIADPANTAIELTAPFSGKDIDADFAAAVAAAAQEMGQEQVTSAEAKAAEAVKAAEAAEAAATRANVQVAPAFKAAADAARSSANAARSTAAAMKSAAEAAADGAKARAAAARANQADAQAQQDAKDARAAANQAYADATAARQAANQAEAEAARARGAAAEADRHAAAAAGAADLAEKEAATAQGAATRAKEDAEAAGKLAESAEGHAKSAKEAADNALKYAKEADEVAKKAEADQEERERKAREEAAKEASSKGDLPELNDEEKKALRAAGISPEEYERLRQLANKSFADFVVEIGGELLKQYFDFDDIQKCVSEGNVEACFWALVNNLPWGKAFRAIEKFPEIVKAINRLAGIGKLLDESAKAKKFVKKAEDALEKVPICKVKAKPNSFTPETLVLMGDGTRKAIGDIRIGQQVLAADPDTGKTGTRSVTDVIIGDKSDLIEIAIDTDGAAGDATGSLKATSGHPFWVENRHRWLSALDLKAGDRLRTPGGELREVVSTHASPGTRTVYNLTVDDLHTYYVLAGPSPVLVHNSANPCEEIWSEAADFGGARTKARELAGLGDDAVPYMSEVGPMKDRLYVGMQSPDGKSGWRIDWDKDDPKKGFHVNWWKNFDRSKKRSEMGPDSSRGAIHIPGEYQDYADIARHFPWN